MGDETDIPITLLPISVGSWQSIWIEDITGILCKAIHYKKLSQALKDIYLYRNHCDN